MRTHTPDTAAALQMLYAAADKASQAGRIVAFRTIHHLTGLPMTIIARNWQATR